MLQAKKKPLIHSSKPYVSTVSSGRGDRTCRLLRLRLAYLWLADRCFATVPVSPLFAKNSPPDCFLNAQTFSGSSPLQIKKSRKTAPFYLVEATGLEPAASWSQRIWEYRFPLISGHFRPFPLGNTSFPALLSPLFPRTPVV